MRTTIRFDDNLLRLAKSRAAAAGCSLNDFISDAVRVAVAKRSHGSSPALPKFAGKGLQAGVDLDDSAALLMLMDDDDFVYQRTKRATRRAAEPPTPDPE